MQINPCHFNQLTISTTTDNQYLGGDLIPIKGCS